MCDSIWCVVNSSVAIYSILFRSNITIADGVPYDGVPEEEVVTVHVSVTAIFVFLATAGLVFTVLCLVFNFTYRKKKSVFCILTET